MERSQAYNRGFNYGLSLSYFEIMYQLHWPPTEYKKETDERADWHQGFLRASSRKLGEY